MISSIVYNGDGTTRIFPVDFKILGENFVRVYVDDVEITDRRKYDIINNSIVFNEEETPQIGEDNVVIIVATSESELGDLGAPITDIMIVANNIEAINSVSQQVVPNLAEVLQADDNAAIATQKALEASNSATSASGSATTATTQAGIATAQSNIATTKAGEASASEANTLAYRNTTLGYRNEAEAFKNQAGASATTATTQANRAKSEADRAEGYAGVIDPTTYYTKSEVYTKEETNTQIALAVNKGTTGAYGVRWNQETDVYELLGATNRTQIQGQMKRCVVHNNASSIAAVGNTSLNRTVNYYLNEFNSTLKADGTAATLDGTAGNVMVEIPKFWYKHTLVGDTHEWWVSPTAEVGFVLHPAFMREGTERDFRYYRAYTAFNSGGTLISRSGVTPTRSQSRATFRTQAAANGTGWSMVEWNLLHAVQVLFLTEYGTFNTQSTLGNGNDTGADYGLTTGQSNSAGNYSSGPLNNNMWMSYRGIENWYSDVWEWIDGINISNYVPYVSNKPSTFADEVHSGDYVSTGVTMIAGASNTFVKKVSGEFFPTVAGGSSSTFLTDVFWSATGSTLLYFGGSANTGTSGGGFCLAADSAVSGVHAAIGAGLSA